MKFRIGDLVGVRQGHQFEFRTGVIIADKGNEFVLRFLEDDVANGVRGGFKGQELTHLIDEFRQEDYSKFVSSRLKPLDGLKANLLHCAVGCSTEAGEFLSTAKKLWFYDKELDDKAMENIVEELGDILFYLVGACNTISSTLSRIASENQAKLEKRYPVGYSNEAALARADKGGNDNA